MMPSNDLMRALSVGLERLAIADPSNRLAQSLAQYLELLHKWNQAYNLTAVRRLDDMVGRHVLDSLAIMPWIAGESVLDVGTGAGLPGVPLALAYPNKQFFLLDSNGKKTRFLQEVQRVLGLNNIEIIQSRVEDYHPTFKFDTVVSRAFAQVKTMLDVTRHILASHGRWVAMKGPHVALELSDIQAKYRIEPYSVLGVDGERYCVIIESE